MTCLDGTDWAKSVSEDAALMCHDLAEKLQECEPVTGLWRADLPSAVQGVCGVMRPIQPMACLWCQMAASSRTGAGCTCDR